MDIRLSRSWMYNRLMPGRRGFTDEFLKGLNEFVSFAIQQGASYNQIQIRCPCSKCRNLKFLDPDEVKLHLLKQGFKLDYWYWTCHGESNPEFCEEFTTQHKKKPTQEKQNKHHGRFESMVYDVVGPDNQIHCDAAQKPLSSGIKKRRKNELPMKSSTVAYQEDSCSSSTQWVHRHEFEEIRHELKEIRNEIKHLREDVMILKAQVMSIPINEGSDDSSTF